MTNNFTDSPFGVYSPYGEFTIDRSTFAKPDDISKHLRDIGAKWVQELPPFLAVDIVPEDFLLYSRVGREAGMVPSLIRDPDAVWSFQQELTQTMASSSNRFQFLEVDTEPDGLGGWQNDPEGYVELLRLSHEIIKKASPRSKIIFGGLSGGQETLDVQGTIFLEKALAAGAAKYIDGLEFKRHHLGVKDYAKMKQHHASISTILARYGIDPKNIPLFLETCMYSGDPNQPISHPFIAGLPVQTETEQASGLVRTYVFGLSLKVAKIFWNLIYERKDFEPGHTTPFPQTPFNLYGLINNPTNADGLAHKKLAFYTYKKMVSLLEGSDWTSIETIQESDDICIYKFTNQGKTIYSAWWDYFNDPNYSPGSTKQITIPNLGTSSAHVIEAVPQVASGDLVSDYTNAFKEENLKPQNGILRYELGAVPVFIQF